VPRFGVVFDQRYKRHLAGAGHPERPERLDAVGAGLEWSGVLATCARVEPQPAPIDVLARVHAREYIARVERTCLGGASTLDEHDLGICAASYDTALLAAGGVIEAARRIASGELARAFCAVRPPGHHAEYGRAMGFCIFANVVLAARVLQDSPQIRRVAILDWDVHHGNGTQHLLETDPSVLFVSLHGHPDTLYPGTGYEHEIGIGAGEGYTVNIPLSPGTGDAVYRAAFEQRALPAIEAFGPDALIISAGFDAHADDPLGNLRLSDATFAFMCRELARLSEEYCDGRLLSVLEGGYNLDVLRRCVAEHVEILDHS
jgi:acetoin utilization deacetylase AcuC-like enzyme